MPKEAYVTLKDLEVEHSDVSYQRLNRAVKALRVAGLISPRRGDKNELRLERQHAHLVVRLLDQLREDHGMEKAVAFLKEQLALERVSKLEQRCTALEKENANLRLQVEQLQCALG